ncbi:DNA topoisomerase I [Candidatus Nitrosocosmicus agrestis]|uniref:DNA topoisomerase I n=1 Tax=Candidatus Nitrosocosmicus agrestis TaxID=2563600 RepID=UPI001E38E2AE|nr:DNA topoisomerase I [Candidatus Nitrosocosmicus sp. SS]
MCEKSSSAKRVSQALRSYSFSEKVTVGSIPEAKAQIQRNATSSSEIQMSKSSIFDTIVTKKGKMYVIGYALGHLYRLEGSYNKDKSSPIFDPIWKPLSSIRSNDSKTKSLQFKVGRVLKELEFVSKYATEFIHACDYDQEGEVIGYNILHYACHNKYSRSKRAKFSSLTDEEIINSFKNLLPPNNNLKEAGISRHTIDFIYGINLSRALTNSLKKRSAKNNNVKKFIQLSIGRVQGPTLAFVVEREKEISDHISTPYWNINADFQKDDTIIHTSHFPQKIELEKSVLQIIAECKNQLGKVTEVKITKTSIKPPYPFNLGDLQKEAYRVFKFTPSYTLSIAEKLYLDALISYPRTSSQKLPPTINYNKIISNISKNGIFVNSVTFEKSTGNDAILSYPDICSRLLSLKHLSPNEGKQEDPAHPAIYPTGEKAKRSLDASEQKLLDLITRRFFSTFGQEAFYNQIWVTITVKNKHVFKAEEKKILTEGWIKYYQPYLDLPTFVKKETLSFLKKNNILKLIKIESIQKATQPPPRYNQSTLLQKMEREKIGTKATRSEIINTLYKRNYIYDYRPNTLLESNNKSSHISQIYTTRKNNKVEKQDDLVVKIGTNPEKKDLFINIKGSAGIRPTEMGVALVVSMQKYVPSIVSTSLTRKMEEQLEQIEAGQKSSEIVINQARDQVKQAIESFTKNQDKIAFELSQSLELDRSNTPVLKKNITTKPLGKCPICKKGDLVIKKALKTKKRFAGCTSYSKDKCMATAPLPLKGMIKGTGNSCKECNWPIISANGINQGKKYQWQFCMNPQCPLKSNKK